MLPGIRMLTLSLEPDLGLSGGLSRSCSTIFGQSCGVVSRSVKDRPRGLVKIRRTTIAACGCWSLHVKSVERFTVRYGVTARRDSGG